MASIKTGQEVVDNAMASRQLGKQNTMEDKDVKKYFAKLKGEQKNHFGVQEWRAHLANASMVKKFKWALTFLILVISNAYAIKVVAQMYPDVLKRFGWPVYFARMGGMGVACWTAILYATMARGALTWLSLKVPSTESWLTFFDAHKDLHILA